MAYPLVRVELLDRLVKLGFADEQFYIVHHFDAEPIERHRKYCETHQGEFQAGGKNENVQKRLRIILSSYVFGGFSNPAAFTALAHASVTEVPFSNG